MGGVKLIVLYKSTIRGGVKRANSLLRQSRACSKRLIPRRGKHAIPSPATLVSPSDHDAVPRKGATPIIASLSEKHSIPAVTTSQAHDENVLEAKINPRKLEKLRVMMDKEGGALRKLMQSVLC